MPSNNDWTRVVVLSPAPKAAGDGGPAPAPTGLTNELKALLEARDWFALEQHDPALAMAELCLRDRAAATRAAWGLQRTEQLALVVLQPQTWPQLHELIAAVRRYVPVASIWTAVDGEIVPLGAPPGRGRAIGQRTSRITTKVPLKSVLKHATKMMNAEATAPAPSATAVTHQVGQGSAAASLPGTSHAITREEIDMLLGQLGDEGHGRPTEGAA